jgi:hypothetical protein
MKKIALAGFIVVAAALMLAPASEASERRHPHFRPAFHSRVFIGVGPGYWGPPYPYPYPYPYWYYPPPYVMYSPPPVIVREEPPVYVQQAPPLLPVPPAASAEQPFWYYCPSASAYYPTVSSCPETWVKVAPR